MGTSGIKGTPSVSPNGLTAWEHSPEKSDGMLLGLAAMSPEPLATMRVPTPLTWHTPCIKPLKVQVPQCSGLHLAA